jgi:hypothetical protein
MQDQRTGVGMRIFAWKLGLIGIVQVGHYRIFRFYSGNVQTLQDT